MFGNKSRWFVINQRFLKPLHLHHTDEALSDTAMKQEMRLHNKHVVHSVNLYYKHNLLKKKIYPIIVNSIRQEIRLHIGLAKIMFSPVLASVHSLVLHMTVKVSWGNAVL